MLDSELRFAQQFTATFEWLYAVSKFGTDVTIPNFVAFSLITCACLVVGILGFVWKSAKQNLMISLMVWSLFCSSVLYLCAFAFGQVGTGGRGQGTDSFTCFFRLLCLAITVCLYSSYHCCQALL